MLITMKALREILGENITRAIEKSQLTVRDIAAKLEVSETSIHRWKSGANPPDVNNLEALALLLKMDPSEFYKSEGSVVPFYGNTPLRKYLVIPDEIVEELCRFGPDSNVWANIRQAIELEKTVANLPNGGRG